MLNTKQKPAIFSILLSALGILLIVNAGLPAVATAAPALCYNSRGDQSQAVNCDNNLQSNTGPLSDDKCYREDKGGPSGTLRGYYEIPCDDPGGGAVGGGTGNGTNLSADCKDGNGDGALDKSECGIVGYILTFTNILAGIVGIVIVIMIAVGGIQYAGARDDPQAVNAAKTRIRDAVLALVFYLFAFAFLQWLIPGGVF